MLIKPFLPLMQTRKDSTDMTYLGTVEDNNDPEKLGRIKVRIAPYTDFLTEELPWACPILGSCGNSSQAGGLNVPEIGSQVRIEFPSKDLTAPYYRGAELNKLNRVTLFDEDYPNSYGYKDSNGNFYRVNKKTGIIDFRHESSSSMQVTADGSLVISLRGGVSFTLSSYGTFSLDTGGLEINNKPDGSLEVMTDSDIYVQALSTTINGDLTVAGNFSATNGASGFIWALNGIIEVKDGLITSFSNR